MITLYDFLHVCWSHNCGIEYSDLIAAIRDLRLRVRTRYINGVAQRSFLVQSDVRALLDAFQVNLGSN